MIILEKCSNFNKNYVQWLNCFKTFAELKIG